MWLLDQSLCHRTCCFGLGALLWQIFEVVDWLDSFPEEVVCLFGVAFWVGFDEVAVTTTGLEAAFSFASVRVGEDTVTMHFVIVKMALVTLTALPSHHASALHAVVLPITFVCAGVVPVILAETVDLVALELAFVGTTIREDKYALALFDAIAPFSLVIISICPSLYPLSFLFVVLPAALIGPPLAHHLSLAAAAIPHPLALVMFMLAVCQLPLALRAVVPPLSFIPTSISPQQNPFSVPFSSNPFSTVNRSVLQLDGVESQRVLSCQRKGNKAIVSLTNPFSYHIPTRIVYPTEWSFNDLSLCQTTLILNLPIHVHFLFTPILLPYL